MEPDDLLRADLAASCLAVGAFNAVFGSRGFDLVVATLGPAIVFGSALQGAEQGVAEAQAAAARRYPAPGTTP